MPTLQNDALTIYTAINGDESRLLTNPRSMLGDRIIEAHPSPDTGSMAPELWATVPSISRPFDSDCKDQLDTLTRQCTVTGNTT